jgi:glycosyltransferase involved in cell wall biosynthesis
MHRQPYASAPVVRILQLVDASVDFEARRGLDDLSRGLGEGFQIERETIGRGGTHRNPAIGAASLRRRAHDSFDILHACGAPALAVAAMGSRRAVVFSPLAHMPAATVNWLRAIMAYRRVEVISPTQTLARMLIMRGIPPDHCHLIRPGVDFSRIKRRRDPALRAALGLGEKDHVLLAAGEATRGAAHQDAVWAASILHLSDPKFKLLHWGRGPMSRSVETFARKVRQDSMVSVAEQRLGRAVEFETLLPAADTVLVTARGRVATLPIAMCMAAALPIVSTVTYTVAELLEDRHTALMAPAARPRLLARRVLDLLEDPGIQWNIADMARTEAYEFFTYTRFVNQFRTVYRQLAGGEKVNVPEQAPGAGLRFHGRA